MGFVVILNMILYMHEYLDKYKGGKVMSIEVINKEHWNTLGNVLATTKGNIKIISPFIGFQTAKLLKETIERENLQCTVITRFYREDFLNGVSSLEGLRGLTEAGCEIYALKGLHTKLYLFDSEIAILGSANFTMGGFKSNHELSLLITDETELNTNLEEYFDEMIELIQNSGNWLLDLKMIDDEIAMTDKLINNRRDKNATYNNTTKYGANIDELKMRKPEDTIEQMVSMQVESSKQGSFWLKFEGTGSDRKDPKAKYSTVKVDRNQANITCFPRRPTGISKEDTIYLCALSWDKSKHATPIVTARAKSKGFEKKNIVDEQHIAQFPWMQEYPYFCELYDIEILDTLIENCISLDSLIKEVGTDLYPNTQGKTLTIQELKTRHYQKSHLRITPIASDFIDSKFEDLKKKYGYISL